MTHWNGRSPPIILEGLRDERRFQLRRLTVRRRHERDSADRRMNERRRPHSRQPVLPRGGSRAPGTATAAPVLA
jgi:hypothetical protein